MAGSRSPCSSGVFPGAGPDPLFGRLFVLATSVNFLPAALGRDVPELVVIAVLHLVFINRVRLARAFAASQRVKDLERFEALRRDRADVAGVVRKRVRRGLASFSTATFGAEGTDCN